MLRRSAEHVMNNMVVAIFERLKNLEDEWQFVDTPSTEEPADPHMSTPKPTPSPIPTTDDTEEKSPLLEEVETLTDSPKTEEPIIEFVAADTKHTEVTAGKKSQLRIHAKKKKKTNHFSLQW